MLTSKERAELRTKANGLDTTLIVGKEGVTPNVIAEADILLEARELVKGRALETSLLTAREASDAICEATGADGVQTVGSKFVIYRKSKKLEREAQEKAAREKKKTVNPVKAGVQKRRKQMKEERERKNAYFKQAAIEASIERQRQKKKNRED